ncbi:unnamed protein product [Haemonchus placei]|uniref:G_PROTEIN_RECEP_F1_2 domain-containing protein n=1 Tax=Haemonchus placei TaxID=6290 RepID=A0A158QMM0_HAEPC|nr:unnamed protein product [Haemonchus placei]
MMFALVLLVLPVTIAVCPQGKVFAKNSIGQPSSGYQCSVSGSPSGIWLAMSCSDKKTYVCAAAPGSTPPTVHPFVPHNQIYSDHEGTEPFKDPQFQKWIDYYCNDAMIAYVCHITYAQAQFSAPNTLASSVLTTLSVEGEEFPIDQDAVVTNAGGPIFFAHVPLLFVVFLLLAGVDTTPLITSLIDILVLVALREKPFLALPTFFDANFYEAEQSCQVVGSHIASIHSRQKTVLLLRLISQDNFMVFIATGALHRQPIGLILISLFYESFYVSSLIVTNSFIYRYLQLCRTELFQMLSATRCRILGFTINLLLMIILFVIFFLVALPGKELEFFVRNTVVISGADVDNSSFVGFSVEYTMSPLELVLVVILFIALATLAVINIFCAGRISAFLKNAATRHNPLKHQRRMFILLLLQNLPSSRAIMTCFATNAILIIYYTVAIYLISFPDENLRYFVESSIIISETNFRGASFIGMSAKYTMSAMDVALLAVLFLALATLAVINVFCAGKIGAFLRKAASRHNPLKHQRRMFTLFLLQAACPFIFMQVPAFIAMFLVFAGIDITNSFIYRYLYLLRRQWLQQYSTAKLILLGFFVNTSLLIVYGVTVYEVALPDEDLDGLIRSTITIPGVDMNETSFIGLSTTVSLSTMDLVLCVNSSMIFVLTGGINIFCAKEICVFLRSDALRLSSLTLQRQMFILLLLLVRITVQYP